MAMKKKPHVSTNRAYRAGLTPARGETAFQVVVEQTDLLVVARHDLSREVAALVTTLRGQIKTAIELYPGFGPSLTPVPVPDSAPPIVRNMARAAAVCNVGPMAAVAGAVAQTVADHFAPVSPDILVENGGDLYLHSTRPRTVAVLADPETKASIGIALKPQDFPCSLCASSAHIGHSLSLGQGDLVVTRSADAALADAAATALCNALTSPRDLPTLVTLAKSYGLEALLAQSGPKLTAWGNIELTAL